MFPWNNVPKGSDEGLKNITKYIYYFLIIAVSLFVLYYLWNFLKTSLHDTHADSLTIAVTKLVDDLGTFLFIILPAIIVGVFLLVCLSVGGYAWVRMYYRWQAAEGVRYLQLLPASDIKLEVDKIMVLVRTFGGMRRTWRLRLKWGTPWFRLRFAMLPNSQQIGIYLAYPRDKENNVKDALNGAFPSSEIHDLAPEQFPEPAKGGTGGHFLPRLGSKKGLPLTSFEQSKQSQLGNILNSLRPGTFLDVQFAPTSWREQEERTENVWGKLWAKRMKELDPEDKARRVSLMKRLTGRELIFHVRMTLWSNHPKPVPVVRSTATAVETALRYDGEIWFWKHGLRWLVIDHNPIPLPLPFTVMTWTGDELANLLHLPPSDHWIYQPAKKGDNVDVRGHIVRLQENQHSLGKDELREGVLIGKIKHPITSREVRVSYEQLSKHFVLTGANGMGKTSLSVEILQSMLDNWFENPDKHPGFTIVDPSREIISIIENRLRIAEKCGVKIPHEKMHHFNLTESTTRVPAFNMLHRIEGVVASDLATNAANVLITTPESGEAIVRTKRLMSNVIQSLLEDSATHTILSIDDFLRNGSFRQRILEQVTDPYIRRFITTFDEKEQKRDIEYILHRVDRLLQKRSLRRLFCQPEMTLDIRKYMDEGHIVLIDAYGFKEYGLRAIAGHLINQYYEIAKNRPLNAKFHLMMLDEAQELQLPLLTELLLEDHPCAFGIGLITRDINQFKNPDFMQAIRSNIGMILSCGQTEGADEVESLTRNYLKASFLEKLPERHAAVYVRYKRNKMFNVTTCVVENEPPTTYQADGRAADYAIKEATFNWGLEWGEALMLESPEVRPVTEVDLEIARYMGSSNDGSAVS